MENTALSIEVSSELDDRQAYIVHALAFGSTRSAAAGAAGVARRTFYNWMESNPVFEDAVHRAESIAEVGYTQVIAKAAQEGDWRAALAWLKRRRRSEWGESVEIVTETQIKQAIADIEDQARVKAVEELTDRIRAEVQAEFEQRAAEGKPDLGQPSGRPQKRESAGDWDVAN